MRSLWRPCSPPIPSLAYFSLAELKYACSLWSICICSLWSICQHCMESRRRLAAAGRPPACIRAGGAQKGELEILHSLTEAHILWTGLPYGAPDAELAIAVVSPAPELAACHGARMIASSGNRSHRHISSWIMLRGGGVGMKFNTNIKLYCDQMSPSCDQVLS